MSPTHFGHTLFNSVVHEQVENVENKRARRSDLPDIVNLTRFGFGDWLDAFKFILTNNTSKENLPDHAPELVRYLYSDDSAGLEEFPHENFLSYLRIYLEACPDETALVYLDITDLVENDFYYPEDKVCEQGLQRLALEHSPYQKIIVLTEGSTDSQFLDGSLQLLYPHLYGYYSFMDFGSSNAPGGASTLVNNLKAFVGAGISNRVIAIFDNDTAAKVALKALQATVLPGNIKVLHYPNLGIAEKYPTVGPNGTSQSDINGLACSIELYLGLDVLTINGKLSPVHWKGYDDSLKQYQGEIENKKAIQKEFIAKIERCNSAPELIEKADWLSMKLIFQSIFDAFS